MPPPRTLPWLRLGVVVGWLLFTLMVIAISWAGSVLRGRAGDLGGTLLWNMGWLLWAGATFVVAELARRFPIERPRVARGIGLHIALGVAISISILAIEFLLSHALRAIWAGAPRANPFLGFIVYKFHVYFLIYWMILGATRAYDYYTRFRASELLASQLESRLAQAQLQALQTQLQPHFLFNTHHAIISLMLKQENAAAIKMLTRLSDLLRLTLRHGGQQLSSLRDELAILESYLGIQRERFGDRFRVELDVETAALSAQVPWLLLQPLVENALKHGIEPLAAGGVLRIAAAVQGDRLRLTVTDNGPGFGREFRRASAPGIGLRNTAARLERLYGATHEFTTENHAPAGACVRIVLPLQILSPVIEPAVAPLGHV